MTSDTSSQRPATDPLTTHRTTFFDAVSGSPVLWGIALTCTFYSVIPVLPVWREKLQRYFCSHPLEYALVGLFCIGLAILAKRLVQLRRERAALAVSVTPNSEVDDDQATRIELMQQHVASTPALRPESILRHRIRETCGYLRGGHAGGGLEAHLKHLSETAADRLHDSYSLLLTINWAVPIIGFLGTVIGITLAIANVTPEQLDTSLNSVTGGLAVAFDTTTVAMSFSLVLVFAYDWIKRSEQRVLSTVDDIALRELLPFLASPAVDADPFHQAQTEAALQLVARTESLVEQQTTLWRESVDGLRERWNETLADQQRHLADGLNAGVDATLTDHAGQLHDVRQEFLTAFEQATQRFTAALESDRQSREVRDESARQHFQHVWDRVSDDLQTVIRTHDAHAEDRMDALMEKLSQWQEGFARSTQSLEAQLAGLQQLTDTLMRLADQEQQLERVERKLSENLQAVHAAETFDETLHNLTAAVHMLTARAKPKAA